MTPRLTPIVEGNDSGPTVVFIQGWPDDASLWDAAVAQLRDDYRCVRVTLPNYDGDRTERWGYRTLEIVDMLEAFVREASRGEPVILVLHDWGCYWGHAVHHRLPELVRAVAGIDVAPHYRPSPAAAAFIVAYQGWLCGAFLAGGTLGDRMTTGFAKLAGVRGIEGRLNAWMNYPYRNVWGDLVTGRIEKLTGDYWPTCPLLFLYGKKKPAHFHSSTWLDHVRKVGGEVVGLPCDHWVPRDPTFPRLLRGWVDGLPSSRHPV